jgi:hypothetical protein
LPLLRAYADTCLDVCRAALRAGGALAFACIQTNDGLPSKLHSVRQATPREPEKDLDKRVIAGTVCSGMGHDRSLIAEHGAVLSAALGAPLFPGSLNLNAEEPVKFVDYDVVECGQNRRMFVRASMNGVPVIVSHRFPLNPALRRRLLVFAGVRLRDELRLHDGSRVSLELPACRLGRITARERLAFAAFEFRQRSQSLWWTAKHRAIQRVRRLFAGVG